MITKDECNSLIETALNHGKGKADGVEVHVHATNVATSRFANNSMTQNQAPNTISISVRSVVDGRQCRLTADKISSDDVRNLVDEAIKVTGLLQKEPKILPLLQPAEAKETTIDRFDPGVATASADERADRVKEVIDVAKQRKLEAAGTVSTGEWVEALGNSAGVRQFYNGSHMGCSMTMVAANSSGWAKGQSPLSRNLNIKAMAERAAEKAVASANPVEIKPGHYTVILEPSAVLDLCGDLWYDFTGTSYMDKQSCLLNKLGQQVFGKNINIYDDVYHPLQDGAPFDGEGMPRTKVCLVKNGVVNSLVYGRRSAKEFKVEPTGHGLSEPNSRGEHLANIVIEGGSTSLDEMIRTTDRGVLLTRVWYVREVDPSTKIVTGMTRDGTFLIEHGKIVSGVKNLRFNEGLVDMLGRVEALGPSVRADGEESMPAVVPPMKVAYFNFESTTKF